ncbi:MAG: DUF6335 family protein [Acidobacteriota bacterium]
MMPEPETDDFSEEIKEIDKEFGGAIESGRNQLAEKLREHTDTSPVLSGGDIDAAWEDADVGEESVGGGNPTPDQDEVDEIGKAMGVTFEDNETLDFSEKIEKRDRDRWELDPASAEDFE